MAIADAHPLGAHPFARAEYARKFRTLSDGIVPRAEQDRFIATVERFVALQAGELSALNFEANPEKCAPATSCGIFDWKHG